MTKFTNQIAGVIGFSISIILIAFYATVVLKLTTFGERYISQDHQITSVGVQLIKIYLLLLILGIITLSILFFFNLPRKLLQKLIKFSASLIDWFEMKKFFLTDELCCKKQLPIYLLIISVMACLFLHAYTLFFGEPPKEGFMEKFSSSLFLIAAIALIISSIKINRNQFPTKLKKQIVSILILLSGSFLFIFGEEISWGQRIFNLESFGVFNEYNAQKELNSHNFFNPLFILIYPAVGLSFFIVLFLIWFFPHNKHYLFQLFIPPPSLFFIVFLMACSSFRGHSETFEELLAIFLLLYSIRIFFCLGYKNVNLTNLDK